MQETNFIGGAEMNCMSFDGFCTYMKTCLQQSLGKGYKVMIHQVTKNNDVHLRGLVIEEQESNLSPNIYLDSYYSQYVTGRSLDSIEQDIMEAYRNSKQDFKLEMSFFMEWEKVKDRIVIKLVNYDQNRELLNDVPHHRFLDLAVVFQCFMGTTTKVSGTILIHDTHIRMWNVTTEDLYSAAMQNMPRLFKYDIRNMADVIQELLEGEKLENFEAAKDKCPMYVLTNQYKLNGAAAMFCKEILKNFADRMGCDLYILPSSVHELILVLAADDSGKEELSEIVRTVNATQVSPEEVLSDHAYYFLRETGEITI